MSDDEKVGRIEAVGDPAASAERRYRIGWEDGECFEPDQDFYGITLTVEVASVEDGEALLRRMGRSEPPGDLVEAERRKADNVVEQARSHASEVDTLRSQVREVARVIGCETWNVSAERIETHAARAVAAERERCEASIDLPSDAVAKEVLRERKRQVVAEGFNRAHDDNHSPGALACAAACYALNAFHDGHFRGDGTPVGWPWDAAWWRPKNARRDLIRAAALLIAEVERIDRAAAIREGGE